MKTCPLCNGTKVYASEIQARYNDTPGKCDVCDGTGQIPDEPYEPEHIKLWEMPDSYVGATPYDWYVFLGRHRDSDVLSNSNYTCGLKLVQAAMNKELSITDDTYTDAASVQEMRASHWAVGWVETILIHKSDYGALKIADEIKAGLEGYPVVDEQHFSEMEEEDANETWKNCYSIKERIELIKKANERIGEEYRISIFAARHDYYPTGDNGYISEILRG